MPQTITTQQQNTEPWESSITSSNMSATMPILSHLPAGSTAQTQIVEQKTTASKTEQWSWVRFSHLLLTVLFLWASCMWFHSQIAMPMANQFKDTTGNANLITQMAAPLIAFLSFKSAKAVIASIASWLTTLAQRKKKDRK